MTLLLIMNIIIKNKFYTVIDGVKFENEALAVLHKIGSLLMLKDYDSIAKLINEVIIEKDTFDRR